MIDFNKRIDYSKLEASYSQTSLIRTNGEFQKSCPDYVFRLIDNPEFTHQNLEDTIPD